MRHNIHPDQIPLFDFAQDSGILSVSLTDHTFNNIISLENLFSAWREFLAGKRNRRDVSEFSLHLIDNVIDLHKKLVNGTYQHGGYYAFKINDPKPRNIHKASVEDRLVHHAIYRILYPFFDRKFIHDSCSCRFNKGTHKAMERFLKYGRQASNNHSRTVWVLKCDIKQFFASIDHRVLKKILIKQLGGSNENTFKLLEQVVDSFSTAGTEYKGLPLGNLTSQLLVNVYMNQFDQYMKRQLKVKYYIRYADDFVILSVDKAYLQDLVPKVAKFLETKLELKLHPKKLFIKTFASGVDFLGWIHFPTHRVLRTTTKRRMFRKFEERVESKDELQIRQSLASYGGMLVHGNAYKLRLMLRDQANILGEN